MTQARKALGEPIKAIYRPRIGGFIKRISETGFEGRLIRWHVGDFRDLVGEWFSQKTYLMRRAGYPVVGAPVNYQHGMHKAREEDETAKDFGSLAVGIFTFADEDDIGLFIRGELKTRKEYIEMLQEIGRVKGIKLTDAQLNQKSEIAVKAVADLISDVPLQFSGGFDPTTWIVDPETAHIDQSGVIHGAWTPTPADNLNPLVQFKSAWDEVLKYEPTTTYSIPQSHIQPAPTEAQRDDIGRDSAQGDETDDVETGESKRTSNDNTPTNKDIEMDFSEAQLQALVDQLVPMVAAQLGVGAPSDEDKQAVSEATTADIEAAEAEAKAEHDDDEEDEDEDDEEENEAQRSVFTERVMEWVSAHAVKRLTDKQKATDVAANGVVSKAVIAHQKTQPATQRPPAYTGNGNGNGTKSPRITVEEMRAYAGMNGQEMALGIKLVLARVPEWERAHIKLSDFVERGILSESYIRTMAHKGAAGLEGWEPLSDAASQNDFATMKSISWLKADELHATDITNQGTEWIEFLYDTQLWRRARELTELFNRMAAKGMRIQDIPTGVRGMNIKLETASGTVYTLAQGGSTDAGGRPEVVAALSQITTDEVSQDLATHIIAQGFTFQLMEQSIIDVVSYLNEDMQTSLVESIEDVFVNGDTETAASTNINLIDGTPGTGMQTPVYIAFNGIRQNALIANTGQGTDNAGVALAAVDYERVRALWPLRIRRQKQNILLMIDEGVETQTRRLAEAFTVGVAGDKATFFSGDLSVLVGFDVYASGFLAKTDGNGKLIAAGTGAQGGVWGIYCPFWQYGRQLDINIEEARYPLSQASVFVARISHLLKARSADASVALYDIGV